MDTQDLPMVKATAAMVAAFLVAATAAAFLAAMAAQAVEVFLAAMAVAPMVATARRVDLLLPMDLPALHRLTDHPV